MTTPLRLGIAGLGTVGTGVVRIVRQKAALLKASASSRSPGETRSAFSARSVFIHVPSDGGDNRNIHLPRKKREPFRVR